MINLILETPFFRVFFHVRHGGLTNGFYASLNSLRVNHSTDNNPTTAANT
jgi:hypothetical protein